MHGGLHNDSTRSQRAASGAADRGCRPLRVAVVRRWLSGPMQILVKCFMLIWRSKKIGFWKRLNCYW